MLAACCVLFYSAVASAVTVDETFVFGSVNQPPAVEFQGSLTGQPRFNSGVNYFDMAGSVQVVSPAYQAGVFVPDGTPVPSPFPVEGFAWNDTWGWISFKCAGGLNRGQACGGTYQTFINITSFPIGDFTGQAWNPQIGTIDFDSGNVELDFSNGRISGYAWNDSVGWLYFTGEINPIPALSGFTCGNSLIEAPEQCDDGNLVNSDVCRNDCSFNACGDGYVTSGEQCDDNNVVNGDGCNSTCQNEVLPTCGDGVPQTGEWCDDGNSVNNDECKNNCTFGVCGDNVLFGLVNGGTEQCDDGNTTNGDGCNASCEVEPPAAICGDGTRQAAGEDGIAGNADDEECDDGTGNRWEGLCLPICKKAACGDTYLYPAIEQCDDGNTVSGDGCTGTSGPIATWCKKEASAPPPQCGNNVTTSPETCDDGNTINGDGCSSTCLVEPSVCGDGFLNLYTEECDDGDLYSGDGCSSLCQDEVSGAVCGNGSIEPNSAHVGNEECDDGNTANGDGCNQKCKAEVAWCGDGTVNGTEKCDDANLNDNDVCKNNCTFGSYGICGNGSIDFGEDCDDGNSQNGDSCSSTCQNEVLSDPADPDSPVVPEEPDDPFISINDCEDVVEYFSKLFNIELDPELICNESCGNGYLEGDETCDDGNNQNGDGCSASCEDTTIGAVCGNGIEEIDEECDDGGNESGDGCSAYCEDEDQVITLDDPTCEEAFEIFEDVLNIDIYAEGFCNTEPYCGDGYWDIGEECDPTDPLDPYSIYCNDWCEFYPVGWCGDGIQDPGEECDDGNFQDGDGCDEWCEYEYEADTCGNGLWSLGEECEAGVPASIPSSPAGLYCSNECELFTGDTCGDGNPGGDLDAGEECDYASSAPLPPDTVCTASCELEALPPQLTCFPFTDVTKRFDVTKGDVYDIFVQLNCLEEATLQAPWQVSINGATGFTASNTVYCNQLNGTGTDCLFQVPLSNPINGPETGMTKIGEVYSYAPTGYVSKSDNDNSYTLNSVEVKVMNTSGNQLYKEDVPVNYSMDFRPLVESVTLTDHAVSYVELNHDQPAAILSKLYVNVSARAQGIFTLGVDDIGGLGYKFLFDNNLSGTVQANIPADTDQFTTPLVNLFSGTFRFYMSSNGTLPLAKIVNFPLQTLGTPYGENINLAIHYIKGAKHVWYNADHIPDAEDFRVDGYGVQIGGPINTDKILGASAGFTQVGNVGETVTRKDIASNVARIVKKNDIAPSAPVNMSFSTNNNFLPSISGGDFLDYQVSTGGDLITDQYIYYFKDDVVLSLSGGLKNAKNRAIIVEGGDVYIDSNITNLLLNNNPANALSKLEIIALKDKEGRGGNVFIAPSVTYFSANIFTDGSMFPYDGTKSGDVPDFKDLEENGHLDNQLTFEGSLTSNNTIGGAESTVCTAVDPCYKGDGSRTTVQNIAKIYDLDYFRRHGLIPGNTDSAGNPQDCDGDSTLEITGLNILTTHTCGAPSASTPKSDMNPAGTHSSVRATNENYGMYFNYIAPAQNSVIFRGAGKVNVSGN